MVINRNIIGPIIFILVCLVAIPVVKMKNRQGYAKFEQFTINGKVENFIYKIPGERGFFILMNDKWYNIVDIEAQEYILVGDSIYKDEGQNCFKIYRSSHDFKEICNSIIHMVNSKSTISKLNHTVYH